MAHAALSLRHSELWRETVCSKLAMRQKCLLTVPSFAVKTAHH